MLQQRVAPLLAFHPTVANYASKRASKPTIASLQHLLAVKHIRLLFLLWSRAGLWGWGFPLHLLVPHRECPVGLPAHRTPHSAYTSLWAQRGQDRHPASGNIEWPSSSWWEELAPLV